ncbi:restriction endonuclease subunit S [uncultured Fibrobacter sp.]|uniref:restriction endonuclease subunit S n=1 Tax=uncultured Fibrobacter sp. TaxID=261512 RepID=UPI0025FC942D|nr:restriction endonuclease subunit S [uncultured Fibrobacter sp.]
MDGKQLKNSILQWAIQGKLVPQNPKDEPAQKLLERIAASRNAGDSRHSERSEESSKGSKKTSLRGAKATKQSKALSSRIYRENGVWYEQVGSATPKDITDEIPFEIPETWAWCRIGDIFYHTSGKQQSSSNKKGSPQKFITTSNLYWGRFVLDNVKVMNFTDEEIKSCSATKGDLLVCEGGAGYGRSAIWNEDYDICLQNHIHRLRPCVNGICEYVYYFIYLLKETNRLVSVGTAMPGLSANRLKGLILPLPPLAEQKRIVAKLEQVLPLAEEYGAAQKQLDKLNKELPEALKKSILQEAIQGKLVPQNPKDEPAQKLLERIVASRNGDVSPWSGAIGSSKNSKKTLSTSLRGAKATKQSKNPPSRIYRENGVWYEQVGTATPKDITDEIPFEIPESWAWCRLGNCSDYAASKEKAKSFNDIQEMWSLDLEDIEKNSGRIVKRLKVSERKIVGEKVIFKKGQVLYSKLRPYLKKILVAPEDGVCSSEIVPFSPFECLDASYLVTVLKSPHVDYTINLVTYGVKMPRVGTDSMLNLLIPIPPLAEQKRIVAKLEQLFKVL